MPHDGIVAVQAGMQNIVGVIGPTEVCLGDFEPRLQGMTPNTHSYYGKQY